VRAISSDVPSGCGRAGDGSPTPDLQPAQPAPRRRMDGRRARRRTGGRPAGACRRGCVLRCSRTDCRQL